MNTQQLQYRAKSFGLLWRSDIEIEHIAAAVFDEGRADVVIGQVERLAERIPIHQINRGFVYPDGFRFDWNGVATFDMFDGSRIDYCPGPQWTGTLPWPFYSTVTALLLAWRGALPFHGCAVSVGGQGILICGDSGAGKSSLTAALVAEGAKFISDDLSVVVPDQDGDAWNLVSGRSGIRLFPAVGQWFFGDDTKCLPDDPRGKIIAVPRNVMDESSAPLRHIIFLGSPANPMTAIGRFIRLRKNLFRPNWLGKLPNIATIRVAVRDISASTHITAQPAIGQTDEYALRQRAISIIDKVRQII